jgi:ectoine hydroxylase-related dioxygenase (phytanoyl-CoA dioxygenase family)
MADVEAELAELERSGFVILESVLGANECTEIQAALAPFEHGRPMGRNAFEGQRSQRVYSLAGKGEVFMRLAEHPRVVELLDRLLLPNWLLSTLQSIRLHPGEIAQAWHTDDSFYHVPRPRSRLAVSAIWAFEPFTAENGATELVPGSHLWAREHPDDRPHEVVSAVMPAGSVVLFDGALWHRGGANQSQGTRLALSPQYCQPWLRPQESQLLIVPPEQARACSPRGRSMLGYSIHPPFIGQVDGMNPIRLVDPDRRSGNREQLSPEALAAEEVVRRPR